MKKVDAVVIGAGQRGMNAYAPYALRNPHEFNIVAVAEPNEKLRDMFAQKYSLSKDMCFRSWEELFQRPQIADAAIICTQDNMHYEPAMWAMRNGYHVLLEKPMSTSPKECIQLKDCAMKYKRILCICHVLRYTTFFSHIKKILDEGRIGRLILIQHNENIGYWHFAHSYVRGNWRNSEESSPIILAKCCHDMDIMLWLAGSDCKRISSFGTLTYFVKENKPKGAPERCLDGCPVKDECPYYAPNLYLTENTGWPTSVISTDTSIEMRVKALLEGPYGRCVFSCDNNVVDHQVVNLEFSNEVMAAFSMCAFTNKLGRTIKLMGTRGEIRGNFEKKEIEVSDFLSGTTEVVYLKNIMSGHGSGDYGILSNFIQMVRDENFIESAKSLDIALQSHIMAFAAEKSRITGQIVDMKDYYKEIENETCV